MKERQFANLLRLRRIAKLLPSNPDVELLSEDLAEEMGESVSQSEAAQLLGVKLPELSRLINSGKLKTQQTSRGKAQVMVWDLLDLAQADEALVKRDEPKEPEAEGDSLEAGLAERKQVAEMRALAYHRSLARNLDNEMVGEALRIVGEWHDSGKLSDEHAADWERILGLPLPDVSAAMLEYSEHGHELRQNSPFNAMGRRSTDR